MFKARGQPGCYYGYVEIDGVTYKIDARHVGEKANKHFEGTVKRHLKADQQKLALGGPGGTGGLHRTLHTTNMATTLAEPDFDDKLPENM